MWRIVRHHPLGPRRWEWACGSSAYGLIMGYAWTYRQAERRLLDAEQRLFTRSR